MKWYGSKIVPQNRFGVAVLLLWHHNSTANQILGHGTFITCGTFIQYLRVVGCIYQRSLVFMQCCIYSCSDSRWQKITVLKGLRGLACGMASPRLKFTVSCQFKKDFLLPAAQRHGQVLLFWFKTFSFFCLFHHFRAWFCLV